MDFSARVDELQQRVAATKSAVHAAANESREQPGSESTRPSRMPRTPSSGHSSGPTRPPSAHAASGRR
jgi:hypothetical protein